MVGTRRVGGLVNFDIEVPGEFICYVMKFDDPIDVGLCRLLFIAL